jgi:hypothetical protein
MSVQEVAVHSGRDTQGMLLLDGKQYLLVGVNRKRVMAKVRVNADDDSVWLVVGDSVQRIDEVDPAVQIVRVVNEQALSESDVYSVETGYEIDIMLRRARAAGRRIAEAEKWLCALVGCEIGDCSESADLVCAAVHDGRGSAYDILQVVRR